MAEVEDLEVRIRGLSKEDFSKLRDWFHQFEDEAWDRQIGFDFRAGKFDRIIERARAEFAEGKAREL